MIYKMQIPPFPVKSFDLLTTRQAKEIFKWYTDDIPARLDQLQKCIDADVNGTVQLTRGKDSLRPLWSWLVANIQLQELTESDLKESLDAVPKWLHEYIVAGKYKLTTESLSIGMDVAIYLGEVFVHEFPQINKRCGGAAQRCRPSTERSHYGLSHDGYYPSAAYSAATLWEGIL